eukprot:1613386-Ditylum_brightwellii.AAC.1
MEKLTALFAEKIGVWNTRSLQGSVGIQCSANTYAYGSMKGARYRSYVHWKITGILNPKSWSFTGKPARALDPG